MPTNYALRHFYHPHESSYRMAYDASTLLKSKFRTAAKRPGLGPTAQIVANLVSKSNPVRIGGSDSRFPGHGAVPVHFPLDSITMTSS